MASSNSIVSDMRFPCFCDRHAACMVVQPPMPSSHQLGNGRHQHLLIAVSRRTLLFLECRIARRSFPSLRRSSPASEASAQNRAQADRCHDPHGSVAAGKVFSSRDSKAQPGLEHIDETNGKAREGPLHRPASSGGMVPYATSRQQRWPRQHSVLLRKSVRRAPRHCARWVSHRLPACAPRQRDSPP